MHQRADGITGIPIGTVNEQKIATVIIRLPLAAIRFS